MAIGLLGAAAMAQAPTPGADALKLRLTLSRSRVHVGENVELRFDVQNTTAWSIFVCRRYEMVGACWMDLRFEPLAKVSHMATATDCLPLAWRKKDETPVPFEKALRDSWISLAPDAYYGTSIELTPRNYPEGIGTDREWTSRVRVTHR